MHFTSHFPLLHSDIRAAAVHRMTFPQFIENAGGGCAPIRRYHQSQTRRCIAWFVRFEDAPSVAIPANGMLHVNCDIDAAMGAFTQNKAIRIPLAEALAKPISTLTLPDPSIFRGERKLCYGAIRPCHAMF